MVIIIPAYQPDEKLTALVAELRRAAPAYPILIVDDGSDADKQPIFAALEGDATILHHEVNRGKGAAIKTALTYVQERWPQEEGVVTIDADGQHLPKDILRVCDDFLEHPDALVLGSRRFTGNVPFKSRFGNAITRFVFGVSTGVRVFDTQTGLRAFSLSSIPMMLEMHGDRYEYEINVLLYATRHRMPIREVTIETVYIEENKSSHFHAVRDAWRIYKMILLFVASSLLAFLIDVVSFKLLRIVLTLLGHDVVLLAEVLARIISSFCNYEVNKKLVFGGKNKSSIIRYYILAVLMLAADYGILMLLKGIMPELIAKILSGMILYPISFILQRKFVFVTETEEHEDKV